MLILWCPWARRSPWCAEKVAGVLLPLLGSTGCANELTTNRVWVRSKPRNTPQKSLLADTLKSGEFDKHASRAFPDTLAPPRSFSRIISGICLPCFPAFQLRIISSFPCRARSSQLPIPSRATTRFTQILQAYLYDLGSCFNRFQDVYRNLTM